MRHQPLESDARHERRDAPQRRQRIGEVLNSRLRLCDRQTERHAWSVET